MKSKLKNIVRACTPPVLWTLLRQIKLAQTGQEWEYIPDGWAYTDKHPEVKGWNVPDILTVYQSKWEKFAAMVQSTDPLGVAHESDLSTNSDIYNHNAIMSFAYVLALAGHGLDCLSMLDWGGGIGHYYLLAQALMPGIKVDYHCKDVPLLTEYGALLFPDQHFYTDESCLERPYDFVLASTSIHYTEDWQSLLKALLTASRGYTYIAQVPIVLQAPSFVFVQRPYSYGYNTEYLGWCFNRTEFLECANQVGCKLVREFIFGYKPVICKAPEQNEYRGFLFHSSQS